MRSLQPTRSRTSHSNESTTPALPAPVLRASLVALCAALLAVGGLILSCSSSTSSKPCTLSVVAPNSGESWVRGESHAVTWTSANAGGNVRIELYKNGVFYLTLASSTENDGAFETDFAGADAGTQYKVRVCSTSEGGCCDESDNNFTLTSGCALTVTSPAAGSSWVAGETWTISWNPSGAGTVKIELYQGATYLCDINASTANDGEYQWVVSDCGGGISSQYRVKVTDNAASTCYDFSDYFAIGQTCSFDVTNPHTGSTWLNGEGREVMWQLVGGGADVKLELYRGSTPECTLIPSTANDGSFLWTVDDCGGGYSTEYRVKITDVANPNCYAYSDYFTIGEPCAFVFSNPNATSTWLNGETRYIMWTSSGSSGYVRLELYKGADLLCAVAASAPDNETYTWVVSDCGGGYATNYRMKISDAANPSCSAYSDYFTIGEPCSFVFSNPTTTSAWLNGQTRYILWEPRGASAYVKLDLYKGASLICPIAVSTDNDGSFAWLVSDCGGGFDSDYRVKITDSVDGACYAFSEYFVIGEACKIIVTNPFVGTKWFNGDARNIMWEKSGGSGTVNIQLYKAATPLCTIASGAPNTGYFAWLVDDCGGGYSVEYRVRITDSADPVCTAYSDLFSIGEPCAFDITNPYSSSKWLNGDNRSILWTPSGGSANVKLELYQADAFLCTIAASTPNDGSYAWNVSDCYGEYSTEYRVKVTDSADENCYAYSDLFTIGQPCALTVTNPYSGSTWIVGQARTILWNHTGGSGTVNIELYKADTLLCAIASGTPNDGSYSWAVSDCRGGTSSEYRIRVVDAANAACEHYSVTFTITAP